MMALLILAGGVGCRPSNSWNGVSIVARKVPSRIVGQPNQFIVEFELRGKDGGVLQGPLTACLQDGEAVHVAVGEFNVPKDPLTTLRPGRPIEGWNSIVRVHEISDGSIQLTFEVREYRDESIYSSTPIKTILKDRVRAILAR